MSKYEIVFHANRISMFRFSILSFFLFNFYYQCVAQNIDTSRLNSIRGEIYRFSINDDYINSNKKAEELYKVAQKIENDSIRFIYTLQSFTWRIDNYNNLQECESVTCLLDSVSNLIEYRIRHAPYDLNTIDQKLIYFQEAILHNKACGEYKSALDYVDSAFLLFNDHIDFFKEEGALKKYQLYRDRGDVYFNDNNFDQALIEYYQALNNAVIADSIRPGNGYADVIYLKLIKVSYKTNAKDLNSIWYNNLNKSNIINYKADRDKQMILSLLEAPDQDQVLPIALKHLSMNKAAALDQDINLKIADIYLKKQNAYKAQLYLDKVIHNKENKISTRIKLSLLQARLSFLDNHFDSMLGLLDNALAMNSKNWNSRDYQKISLVVYQESIDLCMQAYLLSCDSCFLDRAISNTIVAMKSISELRDNLPSGDDRTVMIDNLRSLSETILSVCYEAKQSGIYSNDINNSILFYIELNKSYNLKADRQFKYSNLSNEDRKQYNALKAEYDSIKSNVSYDILKVSQKSWDASNKYFEFKKSHSFYKRDSPVLLEQAQSAIENDQSIVEYFEGKTDLFTLIINKTDFHFIKSPLISRNGDIKSLVAQLRSSIYEFPNDASYSTMDYTHLALSLFDILVRPVNCYIRHKVIIIPEPGFSNIPFSALLTDTITKKSCKYWPYWCRSNLISTQHSLAFYLLNQNPSQRLVQNRYESISIAPFFENLKFNQPEVKEIDGLFNHSKSFLNADASLFNFRKYGETSDIIHIASHAKSDLEHETKSYILLNNDTINPVEIAKQDLNAQLVFLSACETGIGRVVRAEGVMSLARAFLSAGAQSVISTLWKVDDKSSKDNVLSTYHYLKNGMTKDEAIQAMQIEYIKNAPNSERAFPYYWAAYQCEGDLSPLYLKPRISYLTLVPIISFSLFGLGAYLFSNKIKRQVA